VRHVYCPARVPVSEQRIHVAYIRVGEPRRWVPVGRVYRACGKFWTLEQWRGKRSGLED
jgi:hypothetical protein